MFLFRFCLIVFALAISFYSADVYAEEVRVIHDIKIEHNGFVGIEDNTILNYLGIKEGEVLNSSIKDKALKSLFSTGYFKNVSIDNEGDMLFVKVEENPIINGIFFEGNKKIKKEQLQSELSLKYRERYTKSKILNDTKKIVDLYKRTGRYAVVVDPKIIELSENRLNIVFEINEGKQAFIRKIDFIGNRDFSSVELEEKLLSKEARWYRWFTQMDTYDADRFSYDLELLKRFYFEHGYLDFEVISSSAELTPNQQDFYLAIVLKEGKRYRVNKIEIQSSLKNFDTDSIQDKITLQKGKLYNQLKVDNSIDTLVAAVSAQGYPFVDISVENKKDVENSLVDVVYNIKEGQHLFVDGLNIKGNTRTKDHVIRREFRFGEGDAFVPAKVRRSKQRLENLDYFDKIDVDVVPVNENADRVDLTTEISEKSTGALKVGLGWSSYDGALAELSVQEKNFRGTGKILGFTANVAEKKTMFDVNFVEPWYLDRELALGFDVFYLTRNYKDTSSYDTDMGGFSTSLSWKYSEELSHTVKYTLKNDRILDVSKDASIYIRSQEGSTITSMISQTMFWDYLDNKYNPTEGYYFSFSNDLAGLGGENKFFRSDVNVGYYVPVVDQVVLNLTSSAGYIWGLGGEEVRLNDRYFLGGGRLRGFDVGGANARDADTKDSLGGNWQVVASAQLMFPLGLPSEFGMRGRIFTDIGWAGKPDTDEDARKLKAKISSKDQGYDYSSSMRMSVGVGLTWTSPMGPINIDFAIPVKKERFDDKEYFRINFGTGF